MQGRASQRWLRSTSHRVTASLPVDLPLVNADLTRVERILGTLIDNAIKYSPDGGEVKVSAEPLGDEVQISVSDKGIGIAESDQEKLFQRFVRLNTSVPGSAIQAMGLGLVVCKRLVEAHRVRIWVESERGKASTFHFTLPLTT